MRYICLQLAFPELVRRPGEHWEQLLTRLERMERCQGKCDLQALRYDVSHAVLNAADYGVAQQRERLMIVGFRHPSRTPFEFPKPTHSLDALLHHQGVTGEYWARHGVAAADRPAPAPKLRFRAGRVAAGPAPVAAPWLTVRDAIGAMPDPAGGDWGGLLNHQFQPGARAYPKHTGSCLDFPAKVLKAGRHGVPGGENMLCRVDGSVRYFTIRECARLQTFPDDYAFSGTWTRMTRQLGNAVPVEMCRRVAAAVREHLDLIGT